MHPPLLHCALSVSTKQCALCPLTVVQDLAWLSVRSQRDSGSDRVRPERLFDVFHRNPSPSPLLMGVSQLALPDLELAKTRRGPRRGKRVPSEQTVDMTGLCNRFKNRAIQPTTENLPTLLPASENPPIKIVCGGGGRESTAVFKGPVKMMGPVRLILE